MTETQSKNRNRRRFTQRKRGSSNKTTQNASQGNNKNNNPPKARELKFYLHDSVGRKQSESFGKIREAILIKIQKTFDSPVDLVSSLKAKAKKVYTEPVVDAAATVGTPEQMARQDRLAEKKWLLLLERWQAKVDRFEEMWMNTYGLIWDYYCSKELQNAIKEMPDYESAVNGEPLVLLERVEQLMHTPERAKYPSLTTVEILLNFLKCRQGDKESLVDYLSRFKSERDVVYRILGTGFLDGLARNSKDWDDTWTDEEKKVFKAKELKKFIAVLFLRNSDHSVYSELLVDYRKMFANKQDLYPKTLEDMVDVMRQITPKKKKAEKTRNENGNGNGNSDKNSEIEASNAQTTKGNQSGDG